MDPSRFDRLSRALAATTTRRAALVALVGGLLTSVVADEETDARKNRRNDRRDGGKDDARKDRDRGRDQRDGVQAEKKKKKGKTKKKPPRKCSNGKTLCGASCVDTSSDGDNCGDCGAACAAGQRCQGGTCTCNGEACAGCCDGAACRTGDSDELCGTNGAVCEECTGGRSCQSGSCQCPTGQHFCAGACVNLQTDESHCRECGRECADNQICRDGFCGVPCGATGFCLANSTEPSCCGTECVSTERSSRNCGACGNDCQTQRANICDESTCKCGFSGAPCPEAETCCNQVGLLGECRNTNTDMDHCGFCGRACGPEANRCFQGGCRCGDGQRPCDEGLTCCGNQACFDLLQDQNNCGACGNVCRGGSQCIDGACECDGGAACNAGQTCCNGGCRSLNTDANCGACDNRCHAREKCCNGVCRFLEIDVNNCGACGNVCPGLQGSTTSSVECQFVCSFSCVGQNYDLNNDVSDGCEEFDPQTNHTLQTATDLGSLSCHDANVGSFSGAIFSDNRVHLPPLPGFNPFELGDVGASPLWYTVIGTGGGCLNDPRVTLAMEGGASGCYEVMLVPGRAGDPVKATVVDGLAVISMGPGSYFEGDSIDFVVYRTCPPPSIPEVAFFEAQFHL